MMVPLFVSYQVNDGGQKKEHKKYKLAMPVIKGTRATQPCLIAP
jgi:hypothetical protein